LTPAASTAPTANSFFVVGLSYKTAPVDVREKLSVHPSVLPCQACRLKLAGNLTEVVLLSTCNRVEIYGTAPDGSDEVDELFQHLAGREVDFSPHIYVRRGEAAIRHLFSVAAGLDSMVVGETEITGQVKQAYERALAARLTGALTNRLFQTALQIGKEIRTQTNIGRGSVSVGSVALDLAEKVFDRQLTEKTVMIIGAGKMGEACVKHLAKKGVRSVLVSNRSFERAERLAAEFGGRAVRFENCLSSMSEADIVISSTGCPQTILERKDLASVLPQRRGRPLIMIDIAVPRDINPDVQELENVYLYNIDHLESIVQENLKLREQELAKCEAIITKRTEALMKRFAPRIRRPVSAPTTVTPWTLEVSAFRA